MLFMNFCGLPNHALVKHFISLEHVQAYVLLDQQEQSYRIEKNNKLCLALRYWPRVQPRTENWESGSF